MTLRWGLFRYGCVLLGTILFLVDAGSHSARDRINDVVERAQRKSLKDAVDSEFSKADTDHDGSISRQEFGRYLVEEDSYFSTNGRKRQMKKEKRKMVELLETDGGDDEEDEANLSPDSQSFTVAFFNSLTMIIVTELGDKTFFIAAIMAMKHKRILVYSGAIGALAVMTVLSALIGFALPNLLPKIYTHYAAILLFTFFGIKMLQEAYEMHVSPPGVNEELAEVEEQFSNANGKSPKNMEEGLPIFKGMRSKDFQVMTQAFTLTFLAEWGDRSQIATIALASNKDPFGVTVGGTIGHALCTGLAVVGGRVMATRISEKQVALAGGIVFILFAVHSVVAGP